MVKHNLSTGVVNKAIMAIIVIAVLFSALAALVPTAQDAGDQLTDEYQCEDDGYYWNASTEVCQYNSTNTTAMDYSGIPLGGLFSGSGVVFVIVMAGFLMVVLYGVLGRMQK